jgi:drug/metabolite transporter (DMT)-like permease
VLVVRIHAFSRLHAHTALMRVNLCRRHVDVEAGVGSGGGNLAGDIFCQLGVCADISSVAWLHYWQPALSGLLFCVAQVVMFLAITRGDVSVAAPVMGAKVIFVALFSTLLLSDHVPLLWWLGAGLSATAVGLLNLGVKTKHRLVRQTILLALTSSLLYGLCDVLLQRWAPAWGPGNFFPPLYMAVGIYSFGLLKFAHGGLRGMTAQAWRWVLPGALLNALNNAGIAITLGIWGQATAVNIVYSSRGLFSVLLVWLTGHWFSNTERHAGRGVLVYRLIGAAAMLAAIGLVLS